jgi:hypothetical protein
MLHPAGVSFLTLEGAVAGAGLAAALAVLPVPLQVGAGLVLEAGRTSMAPQVF